MESVLVSDRHKKGGLHLPEEEGTQKEAGSSCGIKFCIPRSMKYIACLLVTDDCKGEGGNGFMNFKLKDPTFP